MTDNPWPDDPSRRKIVLVLNQDDINALDYDSEYDGDVLLNNEEVHILSSHPPEPGPAVQALIDQGVVTSSAVLIQNPFDKSLYYRESEALEEIALAKRLHFSTLCGHLGAREVKVEQIRLKKEEHETTFSVEGGIPVAGSGKLDGKMRSVDIHSPTDYPSLTNSMGANRMCRPLPNSYNKLAYQTKPLCKTCSTKPRFTTSPKARKST